MMESVSLDMGLNLLAIVSTDSQETNVYVIKWPINTNNGNISFYKVKS